MSVPVADIVRRMRAGETMRMIAADLGVSHRRVRRALETGRLRGEVPPGRIVKVGRTPHPVTGGALAAVADECGLTREAVIDLLVAVLDREPVLVRNLLDEGGVDAD